MAVSLVGVTTGGNSTSTITVSTHANTQVDDIVLAFVQRDEGYGTQAWTGNPFTLLQDRAVSGQGRGQIWARQATAAGATSYSNTDTSGNSAGTVHLVVVRGAVMPVAGNTASAANATSTTPTSPTVGSGTLDMLICAWGALRNYSTITWGVASSGLTSDGAAQDPDGYWSGFVAHAFGVAAGSKTISLSPSRTTRALSIYLAASSTSVPKSGSDSGVGSESGSVAASVSGSDSGAGSESGFVADLKAGSDSGVGSEDGFVAQPQSGTDSGAGAESGSISATTSGSDSGVGSDTGTLAAFTSGSDSGAGTESGVLTLPGSDAGSGSSALVTLDASTSGGDTAVGSEGGYVDELFGNLVVSIFAVDPDDGHLIPLPDHAKLSLSRERNGAGSISLDYPVDGLNFDVLRDTITDDRDLEVEIWTVGSQSGALRGYLDQASGDDVAEDRVWSFAGGFAELLLNEALAFPAPIITTTTVTTTTKISVDPAPASYQVVKKTTVASSAGGPPVTSTVTTTESSGTEGTTTDSTSTKGDLEFAAVTPGELVNTLLDQAQDRTALANMERGFTDTHDSAGVAWPQVITSKFSPGSEYDNVLSRLVDFGLAEWAVTWTGTAYRLDLWVIFGRGIDRTVGLRPIVLRKARNLLDAPRRWSVRNAGTTVLAAGSEGVYEHASDADALARRGRRIERFASASNLTDPAAVQAFAQNQLALTTTGELEISHGIGFLPGEPRPVIAFDIGDWVYSETSGSAGRERLRVVQWTLSVDESGPSGTVTLNDTITDALSRLQARIDNLVSGDTVVGTSTSSGGQDTSTPLPPEVLSAESVAFLDGTLGVRAAVTAALEMPVLNVDGTVITDMESVVVQYALASSADVWNAGITKHAPTNSAVFTAPAGQTIHIRAAVVDRNGNTSAWSESLPHTTSDDDIPPPIPSAAVVSEFLGTVRITWDGLTADGAVMYEAAIDFDHVEVHLSTGSLFTPSDATLVGRMFGRGTFTVTDLPYGVTQFARFVAVDWSGNKSDPSAQGSATPAQVVSADVFDGAIGSAKLADLAVITAKIDNLAVNNAKIADLSVGKLTAGSLTVDVLLGGTIKTALTGNRTEIGSFGIKLYNGSNVVVDFATSTGSALVVGEFRTSLSGQRIVFNPGGAVPDTMNFYPSAAGDFARIMARTAPGDGTAAILIDGGAANGTARGRLGAYKSEAFISYVTGDAGGDTSAGFSRTAVTASTNEIGSWAQTQFWIDKVSGSTRVSGSRFRFTWTNNGSDWYPTLLTEWNSGFKFTNGAIAATGNGNDYVNMNAAAYNPPSSRLIKMDEAPIAVDPEAVVRAIESKQWRYIFQVDRNPDAPIHYSPIAEDVAAVLPSLVTVEAGVPTLDIRDVEGVLWEAVRRLIARVDRIEASPSEPED